MSKHRTLANRLRKIAANSMRFCILKIEAKASSVGSIATKYHPAAEMPLAEANTSKP